MKKGLSPRLALIIIAALFVLPLVLAWLMYSGIIDFDPVETRNRGALVEPPVPVSLAELEPLTPGEHPADALERHWVILYALPEVCGEACLENATGLRQVHRAAGREQSRLRLLLLGDVPYEVAGQLAGLSTEFHLATATGSPLDAELDRIAGANGTSAGGSVYLIDPMGNIMLFYAAGFDPNDLKKDLKRLLK